MHAHPGNIARPLFLVAALLVSTAAGALVPASWSGVLRDSAGKPIVEARVKLQSKSRDREYAVRTSASGAFAFTGLEPADYQLSVEAAGNTWSAAKPVTIKDGDKLTTSLQVLSQPPELRQLPVEEISVQSSGGEHLSSGEVSSLPLNARDFSKLLLLAAGTMTDANGAAWS